MAGPGFSLIKSPIGSNLVMKLRCLFPAIAVLALLAIPNLKLSTGFAQGTAFTYQGRLEVNGSPANGSYDLQFALFDAATNGNQIGSTLTNTAVAVTNGLFTTQLDFGNAFGGGAPWLEIGARTNGSENVFTVLSPLQPIQPTPSAIYAESASNVNGTISAGQISGPISLAQLPAAAITNGASNVTINGTFTGNGSGLTNVATGGFTWQTVSGTNQQAVVNTGYVITNNCCRVVVTLPAMANIGDIVRVTGVGAGGWEVAQNAGQAILAENLAGSLGTIGTSWVARDSARVWGCVASSADGSKLVAAVGSGLGPYENGEPNGLGQIYTSSDSGATWMAQNSSVEPWQSIASSADGTKLVAVAAGFNSELNVGGAIYTSTDSGVDWIDNTNIDDPTPAIWGGFPGWIFQWSSVASSADGTKVIAAALLSFESGSPYYGAIYTSTNSGVDWTINDLSTNLADWTAVASSADGRKLVAAAYSAYYFGNASLIYTSTNTGASWTQTSAPNLEWVSVASSADGTKLVAAPLNGLIYTSSDSGATWTAQTNGIANGGPQQWASIASSSDGTKLVALVQNGVIYTSSNSGATWSQVYNVNRVWQCVASSADGSKLVAVTDNDQIYTSDPVPFSTTAAGTTGYVTGRQNMAIELQYIGNGQWMPISHEGSIYTY